LTVIDLHLIYTCFTPAPSLLREEERAGGGGAAHHDLDPQALEGEAAAVVAEAGEALEAAGRPGSGDNQV
jgi:hypothetical protein